MRPVQRKAVGSGLSAPPPADFCIPSVVEGGPQVEQPHNPYHAISQPPSTRPTTSAAPLREWRPGAAHGAPASADSGAAGSEAPTSPSLSHSNNPFDREWDQQSTDAQGPHGQPYAASMISQPDSIASEVTPWQSSTSMVYQDADSVPPVPSLPSLAPVSPLAPKRSPYGSTASPYIDAPEPSGYGWGEEESEGFEQGEGYPEGHESPEYERGPEEFPGEYQGYQEFQGANEVDHVHEYEPHGHPQGQGHLHLQTEAGFPNSGSHEPPTPETPSSYQPSIAADEAALGIGTGSDYVRRRRRGAGITSSSTTPTTLPIGIKAVPPTHQLSAPPAFVRKAMDIRYAHLPQRMLASEILDDEEEPESPQLGRHSHDSAFAPAHLHHRHSHSLNTVRSSIRRTSSSESVVEDTGKIKLFVANPDD